MNKKNRFIAVILSCLLITGLSFLIGAYAMGQSSGSVKIVGGEQGLRVTPEDATVFDIKNMYPGKTVDSEITVGNEGDLPFTLNIDVRKKSGDDILFEALYAVISTGGEELYSGPIDELTVPNFKEVQVPANNGEKVLLIAVTLRPGYGNKTQNKAVIMEWTFYAAGETAEDTIPDPAKPETPSETPPPEEIETVTPPDDPTVTPPPDDVVIVTPPDDPGVTPPPDDPAVTPPPDEEITVNPEWPKLPPTGELLSYLLYLGGALLIAGLLLGKKRRLDRK